MAVVGLPSSSKLSAMQLSFCLPPRGTADCCAESFVVDHNVVAKEMASAYVTRAMDVIGDYHGVGRGAMPMPYKILTRQYITRRTIIELD